MQPFKQSLKEAAWVFFLSRLIILFITYIGVALLPQFASFLGHSTYFWNCTGGSQPNPCLFAWYHWDAYAYVRIANEGYSRISDVAFFPLWPLLMHFGGLLLGGVYPFSYYLAGLLLSNLFFFFALVLLHRLLSEDFEPSLAQRALFYLAFYPYAIFFFVGYTESLFLLLCLGVFLALRRGRTVDWWLAGALGFLATLTRSTGIILAIPFLALYIKQFWLPETRAQSTFWQKASALAPVLLIPAAVVVYIAYLWYTKGSPLIYQTAEAHYWGRHFALIITPLHSAASTILHMSFFSWAVISNILDLLFIAIPIIALVLGWRRLPLHYSLFAAGVMIFSLSFPIANINPFASQPRYLMAAFPIFVVFALWGKRASFDRAYSSLAPAALALFAILFIVHLWVA